MPKRALTVAVIILARVSAGRATVQPRVDVMFDGSECALAVDTLQPSDTTRATLASLVDRGNGIKADDYGCLLDDGFLWGPGGSQNFGGFAGVHGFGEVGPGYVRAYASAGTLISPFFYGAGFVAGNNRTTNSPSTRAP